MSNTKNDLRELSAKELYALAQEREQQEWEEERQLRAARIQELRATRRKLVSMHQRELAAMDAEIQQLGGRTAGKTGGRRADGLSGRILAILEASGETSTKQIRTGLEAQGVSPAHLNQTLAYLKRTGRIVAPRRAVYRMADGTDAHAS